MSGANKKIKDQNIMVLGQDAIYSLNDYETKLNNNVILCGSPGSGKSSLIKPNLYQATGSYVILDPKGLLHKEVSSYLERMGYRVILLDFKNLLQSDHYNPFEYLHDTQKILSMSYSLANRNYCENDPFWNECSGLLLSAIISYLKDETPKQMQTMRNAITMLSMASTNNAEEKSELDKMFDQLEVKNPESWSVKQYRKFRCMPTRTYQSVLITAQTALLPFESPEINKMTCKDDIDLATIGQKKTAVFVVVSDVDRSMDPLANLFFTQSIQELVRYADEECKDGRLPVPVRFFLDDFGTNLYIEDFPKIISSTRSRGISICLAIQSEGQLEKAYGADADTIIGASDTFVYLGGNDIKSAKSVAERSGKSVQEILSQKIGYSLILRRGEKAVLVKNYDMEKPPY